MYTLEQFTMNMMFPSKITICVNFQDESKCAFIHETGNMDQRNIRFTHIRGMQNLIHRNCVDFNR